MKISKTCEIETLREGAEELVMAEKERMKVCDASPPLLFTVFFFRGTLSFSLN